MNKSIKFSRVWAMPNKLTFTIKPIKELVEKYVSISEVIIDPFANQSNYGTITNDLNGRVYEPYPARNFKFSTNLNRVWLIYLVSNS